MAASIAQCNRFAAQCPEENHTLTEDRDRHGLAADIAATRNDIPRIVHERRTCIRHGAATRLRFLLHRHLEVLVRGIKLGIRILEAPSLAKIIKRRALPEPGIETSDDAVRDYIRRTTRTVFHPSGTAKMGPPNDPMAVVDSELRVYGVEGLRVGDNSIMPTLVSGNTNAPAIMIGERCARFITGKDRRAGSN